MYGRSRDGKTDEFGVSGYVYRDTFLIFDRKTESLWYPLDDKQWTAIAGTRKGETIPFIKKPPVVQLGRWLKDHPKTVVLLGSKQQIEGDKKRPRRSGGVHPRRP